MIKGKFPNDKFESLETPFYYYDMELLHKTLQTINKETENRPFHVHYALKANANPRILKEIASQGFGADCVRIVVGRNTDNATPNTDRYFDTIWNNHLEVLYEEIYYETFHLEKRRYGRYYKDTKGVSPMY